MSTAARMDTATGNAELHLSRDEAHLAPKGQIVEGYVLGKHVDAVCGARFVPSRDPDHLPLCPGCREVAARAYAVYAD